MPHITSNDLSSTYQLTSELNLYQIVDIQSGRLANDWHLVWDAWSFQQALENKAQAILLSISACESLNIARYRATQGHLLASYSKIIDEAKAYNLRVGAHISCVSGSPVNPVIDTTLLAKLVSKLVKLGCGHVVLADTCARADASMVQQISRQLLAQHSAAQLSWQFNDASGMALANIQAAIALKMSHFTATLAGIDKTQLGQWQFANLSTEDLTFLLQGMGYCQQLNFSDFVQKALRLCQQSAIDYQSQSGTAWLAARM